MKGDKEISYLIPGRTWCGQHLLPSKYGISTRKETHGLFALCERLPSSGKSDDSLREDHAGGGNRTQHSLVRHRLLNSQSLLTNDTGQVQTSLSERGVPGIGTSALTGNDSGCSGMLDFVHQNDLESIEERALTLTPPK